MVSRIDDTSGYSNTWNYGFEGSPSSDYAAISHKATINVNNDEMIVISALANSLLPETYFGVLIIPTTSSPFTPLSKNIYSSSLLNEKYVKDVFISSETSI